MRDRKEFWSEVFAISSSVTPNIWARIATFGAIATIIWLIGQNTNWIPESQVAHYELIGIILVILLVLRTNSGYDRWYEGRKLWGGIVNQSRNLAQIGVSYGPPDPAWRREFVHWTAAFCHVCRHALRDEKDFDDLRGLLTQEELDRLATAQHAPLYVAGRISSLLKRALDRQQIDRFAFLEAEQQRTQLIDHIGACERIVKTPLAKAFSVKIRRFLFLYLVALPFGIFDKVGYMTPVLEMLVAYALLSLDQIGMELQNPFSARRLSHLPLNDICKSIQNNLVSLLDQAENPDAPVDAAINNAAGAVARDQRTMEVPDDEYIPTPVALAFSPVRHMGS